MRLSFEEQAAIRSTAREVFGASVGVWLFGSRTDDGKKGGRLQAGFPALHLEPGLPPAPAGWARE